MLEAARPTLAAPLVADCSYLSQCPALPDDLAQLADDLDRRHPLRGERLALGIDGTEDPLATVGLVWACARAIRLARPALVQAQIEGRMARE
jgi:hypothetical protein